MIDFLLKPTCVLCGDLSRRQIDLCFECEGELPVLPNYCTKCAKPLPREQKVCGSCLDNVINEMSINVLFPYKPPIDQLISKLKFGDNLISAKILGGLMAEYLFIRYQNEPKPEIIIPVPLHYTRLYERGYNQALELSYPIADKLNLPIDKYCVTREKYTQPQATLSAKDRINNLKNAFSVANAFSYSSVAIVDDVITTGNTITELCKALYKRGVKKIAVWCCAKS